MEMAFFFFHFLVAVLFFPVLAYGQNECMPSSRCGDNGVAIRFPFWLRDHQPKHCGYPGFEVYCNALNQAELVLPFSVKVLVKKIDYRSQVIHVHDPDGCSPKKFLNLNFSASPFQLHQRGSYDDFSLYNCSDTPDRYSYRSFPCLDVPGYRVYALYSDAEYYEYEYLTSCTKLRHVESVSWETLVKGYNLQLKWSKPYCSKCEAEGKFCSLKNSTSKSETECLDEPEKQSGTWNWKKRFLVIGLASGFFLLVLLLVFLYQVYASNKVERKIEKFLEDYRALKPTRYSFADIKRITNDFKDKLGQGGFGIVYKGKLSTEIFVAVKVLNNFKGNGEEFINEVGTIGRIHHVNVVRLIGFCADGFRRALVYEFLPNESLEKFIFKASSKSISLGWEKLQDIALGIARGIEYLHQGCDQRILHFDIKPHNILLDNNFNPKISDFGLAKLCSKEQSAVSMTVARGTMGYIAPEMLSRNFGKVSYKSDVYSFGMLLLEMVGGRKNIDLTMNTSQVHFPEWIYNHLNLGEDLDIRIEGDGDGMITRKLGIIGLWCIQWYPADRPTMKAVVHMLDGEGDHLTIPPNPFAALDPSRTTANTPRRPLQQELAIITETE